MKYEFDVSNMKCGGCVDAVKTALNELDETEVIDVSLDEHKAVVESSKTAEEVAAVIIAAGFPAVKVKSG
ncbi:MAG: heavy-metal-associated domain-containing protein [Gammaproteobacteria bacterium]|nr:heavy-metal-associated domain-containing protein [Gammaproteobacteria bacterium]